MTIREQINNIDANIGYLRNKKEELQKQCEHKETVVRPYSWRVGHTQDAHICEECDTFIKYVDDYMDMEVTSTLPTPEDEDKVDDYYFCAEWHRTGFYCGEQCEICKNID